MMRLKNLVCDTEQIADDILKNWEHDDGSLNFWRGSSNYVYFFTCKGKRYWLRFSKKDENSLDQIKAEIEFLLYLSNNSYSSANPIKSKNDKYIEVVERELETYYAVVFSEAVGANLEINSMTESQFEYWGKSLASLHSLSRSYNPKDNTRKSWKDMLKFASDILSDFPDEEDAVKELNRVERWLNSLPVTNENYGLIHYDFELDNIFFNKKSNEFCVIDFDDSMYHWYAMDIVCALGDLHELEDSRAKCSLKYFLKGYCSITKIDEDFIKLLPKFERFDNLFAFVKLLRSLQDSHFSQEPVWMGKLRPKLLKKCSVYREGFKKPW